MNHGLFLHEQFAHLHPSTQKKVSNIASDEDIMENNHIFAMLWNLSIISHLIFPQCFFFFISGAKSKNILRGYVAFNLSLNKPCFLRVCSTSLLKTLWEKEELLMTSNFSFSQSVFHTFGDLFSILIKFRIVVCKLFQSERVLKCVVWERVKGNTTKKYIFS